ncbi:MAG: NADPH-dependent F420 reductase [Candidatus Dormibacteria bacterium]
MAPSIAILGGTGKEGRGLATRWAHAGREVILGSRDPARAEGVAAEVGGGGSVRGLGNADAAAQAEIIVVATPFEGMADTVRGCAAALAGKLVVSAVIPLQVQEGRVTTRQVPEGSAAQLVAACAPHARVAAAFHNISYRLLMDLEHQIQEEVPFAGPEGDRQGLTALCSDLGAHGVFVGGLHLAPYLEGYTAVLLSVNRLYRTQAGVRFTGLPETA